MKPCPEKRQKKERMRETDKEKEKILQSFKRLKGNYFRRNLGYEMQEDPAFSQPSSSPPSQMDSLWLEVFLPVGRDCGQISVPAPQAMLKAGCTEGHGGAAKAPPS